MERKTYRLIQRVHAMIRWIWGGMGAMRRTLLTVAIVVIAVVLSVALYHLWGILHPSNDSQSIKIQPSTITVESIRPRGELYVCTAVVEDYVIRHATEMHVGLFPEQHSCVQVLKQKVSFKIDLNKVRYVQDTLNVLIVEMPNVEYVASTQDSPFLSDDEDFWRENMRSTNGMKQEVERKIRHRFDTETNRRKASRYAETALSNIIRKMGYEVRFVPQQIEIGKKKG